MYTLGINAAFHDSAACLIENGHLIAAAEDERFTQIKHGKRPIPFSTYELPYHAIDFCLKKAGITLRDVDHIAYSFDPALLIAPQEEKTPWAKIPFYRNTEHDNDPDPWRNLFLSSIINAPRQLVDGYPHHLQSSYLNATIHDWNWHFVDHHLSHAASAFFPSPFEKAAVLVMDGRGEKASSSYYKGNGTNLELIQQVHLPHSLGLLYEDITTHLGFLRSSDEYKVMALASYGEPLFVDEFREIVKLTGNGKYEIKDLRLDERFGPKRLKNAPFTAHHFNIARSLQYVLEESVLELVNWFYDTTKEENLCLAGGIFLNCVLNARIRDKSPFKNIWIQPAAGDSGTALGAAMIKDREERGDERKTYIMHDVYLGPAYSDDDIRKVLERNKVPYTQMLDVAEETATLLAQDKIIGWFQGAMEYGPRALGSRSILASPLHAEMQAKLNEVKDREDFRPVAPVVTEEDAKDWFVGAKQSPFMLFIYDVMPDKADQIPAVKHTDGTARIQTVNKEQHPLYYDLIKAFERKTGVPVLVNTSFNTLGKPIVCTPRDAIECFWSSPFDALIIGSFLIQKDYVNMQEKMTLDENSINF
ncbi:carbamoyltransferase C-terminal domain-containing protein [Olivibacter sp. XZL3]|uniref:carbamoyltransferase family protein n=1 Tax=Olivibacter sp. XZL3 TaxID=1735116 RepID=UPI001064644F|nr:carbamoyltransferase C-terminal domain-containing protein [Olivibacter sp. XZL3]